jgi:hypothetical protein
MVIRVIPAGDLALKNGSPYYIEGVAYIRQKLSVRFRFFLGEWFLNQLEGVPHFRDVFVHDPNLDVLTTLFKGIAEKTPGVLSVPRFKLIFDTVSREASFDFTAVVDGGVITVAPQDQDFIVDPQKAAA